MYGMVKVVCVKCDEERMESIESLKYYPVTCSCGADMYEYEEDDEEYYEREIDERR